MHVHTYNAEFQCTRMSNTMRRFLIMFENFQQFARRLVKCSKSSIFTRSMFKLNTQQLTIITQTVNRIQLTRHSTAASFNRRRCHKINSLHYKVSYSY